VHKDRSDEAKTKRLTFETKTMVGSSDVLLWKRCCDCEPIV